LLQPQPEQRWLAFTVPENQPHIVFCDIHQHIISVMINSLSALDCAKSGDF